MNIRNRLVRVGLSAIALGLCPTAMLPVAEVHRLHAEQFLLTTGARLDGELLNADQSPRTTYEVKLTSGSKLTFARDQVQDVIRRSPAELEYETLRHEQPDNADGHWKLAEWCKENKLVDLRKEHLERIIELEPNNQQARLVLGYTRIQGQWRTQAEHLSSLGKVQHKGQWRYPQEIEILEAKDKADQARQTWFRNLKQLRDKLGGTVGDSAADQIAAITDPAAVPALKSAYEKEPNAEIRELYIRALGGVNSYASEAVLCEAALTDRADDIRQTSLEILAASKRKSCVDYFIQHLTNGDNVVVNRAGVALSYFKDARSVAPLIDALVTVHTTTTTSGNPGQMSAGFGGVQGSGGFGGGMGGGLSMGQSTVSQKSQRENRGVLEALLSIVENKVNYQFDEEAWKHWYSGLKRARAIDVRRS